MFNILDLNLSIPRLKSIVRAYDIRGTVPDRLNENDAYVLGYLLGKYFITIASDLTVVVGMDNRSTSFGLSNAITAGFAQCGIAVRQLGVVPTSALYYEAFVSDFDVNTLGVMVTASHNPAQYNGFKIVFNSKIVDGELLLRIIDDFDLDFRVNNDYLDYLLNRSSLDVSNKISDVKILWDCNNGATQQLIGELIKRLHNKNTIIGCSKYIDNIPDPTDKKNVDRVKKLVGDYDMAFCFDGDGDRLLVVYNNGRVLRGDKILLILSEYFAQNVGNHQSVVDIKTSSDVVNHIKKLGFEVSIQKTGHSFIKKMMCETQAMLGGEVSGHIFFKFMEMDGNYIAYDDALLAACYLLKILLTEPDFMKEIIDKIPENFSEYDLKVYCNRDIQQLVIEQLKIDLKDLKLNFIDIDGVKYEDENGWWLVRQSNTEEALIICIEGRNIEKFEIIRLYLQEKLHVHSLNLLMKEP
jgi:phosphomannomutase/phosphoglucomutase